MRILLAKETDQTSELISNGPGIIPGSVFFQKLFRSGMYGNIGVGTYSHYLHSHEVIGHRAKTRIHIGQLIGVFIKGFQE